MSKGVAKVDGFCLILLPGVKQKVILKGVKKQVG